MTLVGKLLLFVNLALSLLFASWAVGVYARGTDFRQTEFVVGGERVNAKGAIDRLAAARDAAEQNWRDAHAELTRLEAEIPVRATWYRERLKVLQDGQDLAGKPVQPPARQLVAGADGRLTLGRPITLSDNKDLQPANAYREQFVEVHKQIDKEKDNVLEQIKQETALTQRLNGDPGKLGGLRKDLAEAELALHNCREEKAYLEPLVFNRLAESQLLLKRKASLEARLKELLNVGVAAGEP